MPEDHPVREIAAVLDLSWVQQRQLISGSAFASCQERIFPAPRLRPPLAISSEIDEARRISSEFMEINPKYSFSDHGRLPFKRQGVQRIIDGLAKAGLAT